MSTAKSAYQTPPRFDGEASGDYALDLYRYTAAAPVLGPLADIGDAELARYADDGYVAVAAALTPSQIADAIAGLTAVLGRPAGSYIQYESWAADRIDTLDGSARLDVVRKFMQFVDADERLHAIAYDERLLGLVRRILGDDDVVMLQDMALLKPPGGGREKPWHQDKAYFNLALDSRVVGVWIALDAATPENGCMHVIPGSHREGPMIHFRRRDWQICDSDVPRQRDVMTPLPPGGALFFDGLLQHGTPTNRTNTRRRALQFHYVPRSVVEVSEDERMAVFGSEGKDVTC